MNVSKTEDNSKSIQKSMDEILGMEILVGVPESTAERSDSEINNAQIGYINEYGSPIDNIPARPHLIPGVEAVKDKTSKLMGQALKRATNRQNGEELLERAGAIARDSVKNTIVMGTGYAPSSPATLAARRREGRSSDKPLIDTSQYYDDAITYVVVEGKDGSS